MRDVLKGIYTKRSPWAHKGDCGRLLVIGGSKKFTGSPALVALAAIKSGADWVDVAAPERAANIIAGFSPDLITYPLFGDYFNQKHLGEVMKLADRCDAVVIGNGMGREKATLDFVLQILARISKPCVIDADAIHAFEKKLTLLKSNYLLTPHSHEFYTLTGIDIENNVRKRTEAARTFAEKTGATVLLKGHIDVISNGKKTETNSSGDPIMAKAGTGDTLTGICGALLARGISMFDAACAGAYINGKAGELAVKKYGEGLMAENILEMIPVVIKSGG